MILCRYLSNVILFNGEVLEEDRHIPKVIHNRPGLTTLRCVRCQRKTLQEYTNKEELDKIYKDTKFIRNVYFGRPSV